MTVYDTPILAFFAFVCLAAAIFVVLKYYKKISRFVLVLIVAGAAVFIGFMVLGLIGVGLFEIGSTVHENYTAKQCLTAHERRAKAMAAPDDYFGRQLREQAMEEEKRCAEIAAKREAIKQK